MLQFYDALSKNISNPANIYFFSTAPPPPPHSEGKLKSSGSHCGLPRLLHVVYLTSHQQVLIFNPRILTWKTRSLTFPSKLWSGPIFIPRIPFIGGRISFHQSKHLHDFIEILLILKKPIESCNFTQKRLFYLFR